MNSDKYGTSLQVFVVVLLLINAAGAYYGGNSLIRDPSGSSLGLKTDLLEHSPFTDYYIPGIVLFLVNGVFCTIALLAVLVRHQLGPLLVLVQGLLLTGWILVQMLFIQTFHPFHLIFGGGGLVLIYLGWRLLRYEQRSWE